MIRIIHGKRYNSKTAQVIAEWDNGCYGRDFKACQETLFRTTKGAFFLEGSGGPMSKYARKIEGGFCGGSSLEAFTDDEAFNWLLDTNAIDALEKYFAHRIEDA